MSAVYLVLSPLPEIQALPGDHVVVRTPDDRSPVEVVKRFDRHTLVRLMGDGRLDQMKLVAGELALSRCAAAPPWSGELPPLRLVREGLAG